MPVWTKKGRVSSLFLPQPLLCKSGYLHHCGLHTHQLCMSFALKASAVLYDLFNLVELSVLHVTYTAVMGNTRIFV